ncbi:MULTISPECIES: hypothetical protein [unclassified Acidovorax]|uniref:hypothetical protein n=1 Tax=unclassified Acidovorax TaxID=2684926 RepID=UPI000B06462E|nr:hypothetical protein [Acidovorax sp. Root568]
MSAPIQLIRLRTRRTRHHALRIAVRIGMLALCFAVGLTVCALVYPHLPRW